MDWLATYKLLNAYYHLRKECIKLIDSSSDDQSPEYNYVANGAHALVEHINSLMK